MEGSCLLETLQIFPESMSEVFWLKPAVIDIKIMP